jgi:hypothetical protein
MTIIGIDPGLDGAIAMLRDPVGRDTQSMPALPAGQKGRRVLDVECVILRLEAEREYDDCHAVIERPIAMPKQSCVSTAKQFEVYGLLVGMCAAICGSYAIVRPRDWQKVMLEGEPGKDTKAKSLIVAKRLFGETPWPKNKSKAHGVADALLIAEYGRRLTMRSER